MYNPHETEDRAQANAESLLRFLLPDGKKQGSEYVARNPRRDDRTAGSFSINLKTFVWADFAVNERGRGLVSLWSYVQRESYKKAWHDLNEWLGLETAYHSEHISAERTHSKPSKVSKEAYVRQLWKETRSAEGSLVEAYLLGRGIKSLLPSSIRYAPKCWHSEAKRNYPAMIAAVTNLCDGQLLGVHRTYLCETGARKAQVASAKKMLGDIAGGGVVLAPIGERLAVAEGIETALSFQQATRIPTCAALSTSGMVTLVLPCVPLCREIFIAADNDPNGRAAAEKAAHKWMIEGRVVRIVAPNNENDFNDVLRRG